MEKVKAYKISPRIAGIIPEVLNYNRSYDSENGRCYEVPSGAIFQITNDKNKIVLTGTRQAISGIRRRLENRLRVRLVEDN